MPIGHGRRRSRPSLLMERIGSLREELVDATEVQAPILAGSGALRPESVVWVQVSAGRLYGSATATMQRRAALLFEPQESKALKRSVTAGEALL